MLPYSFLLCVLVSLGIKNSLESKQLSKCLPRRHPQKHYNLNKTCVLTWQSSVLTRLRRLLSAILLYCAGYYWMDYWLFIPSKSSRCNVIYCRIIHKIAGDDRELETKYYQLFDCTERNFCYWIG